VHLLLKSVYPPSAKAPTHYGVFNLMVSEAIIVRYKISIHLIKRTKYKLSTCSDTNLAVYVLNTNILI